jgi:archaellum biogenesis ATPase FlaH
MSDFLDFNEAYKQEEEIRLNTDFSKLCRYGVKLLDDSLLAIAKNELVVIGADSGVGKSSLVLDIARHNAKQGKKVALFYLEGGHIEAIQRMKWQDISDLWYSSKYDHQFIDMDFRKWMLNHPDNREQLTKLSSEVYSEQSKLYQNNLFFYPITEGFKIEELLTSLVNFHKLVPDKSGEFEKEGMYDLDLIIIDHLQYFSLDQNDNEITEITRIIRECKKITDHHNIPVILVSHLRKKNKDRGLPDQEDFYGSSNIPKISTTAITVTPYSRMDNLANNIYPTFFRIVKSRVGIRPNLGILCDYDLTRREYKKEYKIYRLDSMGNVGIEPLTEMGLPKWAR